MKIDYNLHWLFVGFVLFYVITLTALFLGDSLDSTFIYVGLPFMFWGVASWLDYMLDYIIRGKK